MAISNIEARVKKLENTNQTEVGIPNKFFCYPVRKLTLTEEKTHNVSGVVKPVLVATWDKPAGIATPDSIRIIHNTTTEVIDGTATSFRTDIYSVGTMVTVSVTANYPQGSASVITTQRKMTGDTTAPSIPTNFTATGGFNAITLKWTNPTAEDFSHVEVWESTASNDIATAERVAQAYGTEYVRTNCATLQTRWYWIRAIDTHGNFSDFTSVASGTTNAIQASDIPINTITESMLIDALEQKINDSDAAIQIVEDVRMGEVNVFRQASAPTTGMITGDLWIDNTEVVHRYEGGEWVSKEGTPVYDLLKTAIAQYVVKTQTVTGDGQLKVAGFGLYNDATTGSEFAILADKFYVYAQKEDGSSYSNIQVFTVDTTTTPPTVGINGNLLVNGSIVGEKIFAGSKIQLNSGGELVIGSGGKLQVGDELSSQFSLDSSVGVITVREPGNITYGEYMQISVGQIKSYKWYEGAHREMKVLRAIETGTATNGVYKTTTGRFTGIPSIIVTPNSVPTFMYQETGTQMISFTATNITHDANTGRVTFLPTARLESLGAGSSFYVSPPTQEGAWNNPSAQEDYCLPSVQEITHTFSTHTVPAGNGTYTITGACISGPAIRSYEWGNHSDSYTGTMYVEVRETQGTGSAGAWTVVSQIAFPRSTIIYASPWASAMPGGSIASHWVPFSFTRNIGLSTIKVEIRIRHVLGVRVRGQSFYHLSTHAGYGAYSRIDSFSYQQPGKVFAQGGGVLNYMAISG